MSSGSRGPWSIAWHVALLASFIMLGTMVVWRTSPVVYALGFVAAAAFLIGLVWLAMRLRVYNRLRDPQQFRWLAATALALLATALVLPRSIYQWSRFDNETPIPQWAFDLGMGLAIVLSFVLLMLAVWLAWAILIRLRREPDRFEAGAALVVAVGIWLLFLGAIIVRTDHTSEDILSFTLPYGLGMTLSGTALLVMSSLWRHIRPDRDCREHLHENGDS